MLYLSNAKTSLAASILTLVFIYCFSRVRRIAPTRLPLFLSVSIVGLVGFFVILGSNYEAILNLMGRDATLTNRSEIWGLVEYFTQDNFWRGNGYRVFFAKPDVQMLFQQIMQGRVPAHSHNIFIEMMLDGGIIGVILLLLVILQAFTRGITYSISQPWAARYWYLAIMLYILIIGQVEAFSFSNYLWVLVVLVSGVVPTQQSTPATVKQAF
jgi:exopolysaccharide production protein ExoQ